MNKINKQAKTIIDKCVSFKSQKDCCDIELLLHLLWRGASSELLNYFYQKSKNQKDFRNIAFILEEGPFKKSDIYYNSNLLPLLRKLISIDDLVVVDTVFATFSEYATSKNDLAILLNMLESKKYILPSTIY